MLEAVELPAGVAGLDAGLADVNGDNLTHGVKKEKRLVVEKKEKEVRS